VESFVVQERPGEIDGFGISMKRHAVDHCTAGIRDVHEFCHLVESFTGSIVNGLAQRAVSPYPRDLIKMRMPAGDDKRQKREFDLLFEEDCQQMGLDMIHADQRETSSDCNPLGCRHPHKQCADKPRTACERNPLDIRNGNRCFGESLVDDREHRFQMLAGGYLRNYSAVLRMNGDLGRDDTGKDGTTVLYHRRSGLVTRCLDTKKKHTIPKKPNFGRPKCSS